MNSKELRGTALDLNALRVFVTVADSASFSDAAKKLDLPKWSVSRSVSALEAAMGVPLLHRTTRRVSLSPAGVALHARIAPLIASLDVAANVWPETLGEPAGDVHLTVPNFFHAPLLTDALTKFAERYPAVHISVHFVESVANFAVEGCDIAVVVGPPQMKDSSLVARRGWRISAQFFASPAYLTKNGIPSSLSELAGHSHITYGDITSYVLQGPDGTVTFKPNTRIRSNNIFFVRSAVQSSAGIGMFPTYLVENDLATGRLVRVLPPYSVRESYVYIIRPNTREVPLRIKVLSDFLFEYMKANPLTFPTFAAAGN